MASSPTKKWTLIPTPLCNGPDFVTWLLKRMWWKWYSETQETESSEALQLPPVSLRMLPLGHRLTSPTTRKSPCGGEAQGKPWEERTVCGRPRHLTCMWVKEHSGYSSPSRQDRKKGWGAQLRAWTQPPSIRPWPRHPSHSQAPGKAPVSGKTSLQCPA